MRRIAVLAATLLLSSAPALAFDCARATTAIDKAICANAAALAANDAMEKAYADLRARLDGEGRKLLLDGQRSWIRYRDERCGTGESCLAEQSGERAEALKATPAGTAPFFLFQPGVDNGYAVKMTGYRFTGDFGKGEAAYNRWLDGLIADSPYGDPPDEEEHQAYEWEVDVAMHRLSARLISAVGWLYNYTGGAHPNSGSDGFLADRGSGAPLAALALFGGPGLAKLERDCARQIIENQSDVYGDVSEEEALKALEEGYPGAVKETVGDMERWHVDDEGVHVRFDSYAIAPYAAGTQECVFPLDGIRTMAKDPGLFE